MATEKALQELQELEDKLAEGFEKSYLKLVAFKKYKNSPLVVSRNGKIIEIKPEDIPPTMKCKR